MNYYTILGLQQNASEHQIKEAYHKLAAKYHPDKNPGNSVASDMFKLINQAYEEAMKNRTTQQNTKTSYAPPPSSPASPTYKTSKSQILKCAICKQGRKNIRHTATWRMGLGTLIMPYIWIPIHFYVAFSIGGGYHVFTEVLKETSKSSASTKFTKKPAGHNRYCSCGPCFDFHIGETK